VYGWMSLNAPCITPAVPLYIDFPTLLHRVAGGILILYCVMLKYTCLRSLAYLCEISRYNGGDYEYYRRM
jgi:hypothetical protein